jgi:hemerythrin-like domain-containing protein
MQPTEILMNEHRVIEQVLRCLEAMAVRCFLDLEFDPAAAREAVDFLETFADQCHHAKEENHLFPLLEARGLPRDHGPTEVMRHEHEQGRRYLRAVANAIEPAAAGDPHALRQFAGQAAAYVALLRQHIAKEDQRLFPLADHCLTDEDQAGLVEAFADVESRDLHMGTHEKYLAIADRLADRFDVRRAPFSAVAGHGCCSCGHHG